MTLEPSKHSVNLTAATMALRTFPAVSSPQATPDLTVTLRPAYQLRLFAERDELATRLAALQAFIKSDNFATVDTAEQHRLLRQELSMIDYLAVLNERVAAWGGV